MRARIIATSLLFGVLLPTTPHRLAAVAEPKPAPQVSASEFEAVAPPERLDFVKALLRARDAALQNFSYHVVEIKNNIDLEDGSRTPFAKEEYFVRRLGATHWMRLVVCGPDSKVEADGVMNWDGERAMSFTRFTNREEVRGMIRDRENNNFTFRAFNQILGFRVLGDGPVMSVADWVARYPNASRRLEAAVENRGGKALLKVKVFWDREYKSFWFDFERGLMAVRTEYRYESPDKHRYNKEYTDVVMAEEVAGLWVPTRAVRRTGTSASREETEIVYEVTDFKVGVVRPDDIVLTFPAGTKVVDAIENVAFIVQPDGTRKPVPLREPRPAR